MSNPIQHHYIPKMSLAGFTVAGTEDGKLFVYDKVERRQWQSTPAKSAKQRHFYQLEVDENSDPAAIERWLNTLETEGAEALRELIATGRVPQGQLRGKLMNFLGIMAIRVPSFIDAIEKTASDRARSLTEYVTSRQRPLETTKNLLLEYGVDIHKVSWEDLGSLFRNGEALPISQNFKMSALLHFAKQAASSMAGRYWAILRAPADGPGFICSDAPMTAMWKGDIAIPYRHPSLAEPNTILLFPLNRSVALLGTLDELSPAADLTASDVVDFNTLTAAFARRYIYSATSDFLVTLEDGPGEMEDLIDALSPN